MAQIGAWIRKTYERFVKIRGAPRQIALGFSLGVFVGMTPFMGLHTFLAVFFAALLKWNKISAAIAVWITNAFTAPFVYGATFWLGAKIVSVNMNGYPAIQPLDLQLLLDLAKKAPEIFWVLTVGGAVAGLPLSLAAYWISHKAIVRYRRKIKRSKALKRAKKNSHPSKVEATASGWPRHANSVHAFSPSLSSLKSGPFSKSADKSAPPFEDKGAEDQNCFL